MAINHHSEILKKGLMIGGYGKDGFYPKNLGKIKIMLPFWLEKSK
jgi:hypothetical protein